MEQLVILIIIGVISLINWLLQKSAEHKSKRPPKPRVQTAEELEAAGWAGSEAAPEPVARREAPAPDPQEELRRFFEAMGLPLEDEPPPPPPVKRPAFVEPPPLPAPVVVPTPAPPPRKVVTAQQAELARGFAQAEAAAAVPAGADARGLLASPAGLRQAMILREVLGPPRALQELTSPGTAAL